MIPKLRKLAARVKRALEQVAHNSPNPALENFPKGSCRLACYVLGTILEDKGFGQWEIVAGERGSVDAGTYQTHAWLEGAGVLVDITASQFDEVEEGVIVSCIGSRWHGVWEITDRDPANIWPSEETAQVPAWPVYAAVSRLLAAAQT